MRSAVLEAISRSKARRSSSSDRARGYRGGDPFMYRKTPGVNGVKSWLSAATTSLPEGSLAATAFLASFVPVFY